MRLTRGVVDHRCALGTAGGKHYIDGRADRNTVHINIRAAKPVFGRVGVDISAFHIDNGAQRLKALHMLIDRANAEITASGISGMRLAETSQFRAQNIIRSAHFANQLIRRASGANLAGIYLISRLVDSFDFGADAAEDGKRVGNIAYIRKIFDHTFVLGQDRTEDNGNGGIFHTADLDLSA